MTDAVIDVREEDFASSVLEESHTRPVVVDFWAEWCGPCRVLSPTLERLADDGGGTWLLAKVDVDQNQDLARQFGVQGIPTVVAFRDGAPVDRFTGAMPEARVREFIDSIVPTELDMEAAAAEMALDRGDLAAAETGFRRVLAEDPSHEVAGLGLAAMLIDDADPEAALEVLGRLTPTEAVRRMEAAARVTAGPTDLDALATAAEDGSAVNRLAYAKALAAHGRLDEALALLIDLVGERGERSDDARLVVLDLFELLGNEHPLVPSYRRKLASALF